MKRTGFFLLAAAMLIVLLSSCASTKPLRLEPYDSPAMLDWALKFDGNATVKFEPEGMIAAGQRLFIFGSFTTPVVTVRSFVLMSENGGKTWREVAAPVEGSKIITMQFPDEQHGFSLVGWVTEGPGELHVQRTVDGGLIWERMQYIPKDNYSGWPVTFEFTDAKNGKLVLQYMDDNPEDLRPILKSQDGGRTWKAYQDKQTGYGNGTKIENSYSVKLNGSELTLKENDTTWTLTTKGNPEPVFVFEKNVPLEQVVGIEEEACG